MQPSRQGQPRPRVQLLLQVSRSNTNSAHSVDIEDHNVNYYGNYCDPTGSDNLDDNSCSNDNSISRDSTGPDLFHALPGCALSTTCRLQLASVHNSFHHLPHNLNLLHASNNPTGIPHLRKHRVHTLYHDDSTKPSVQSE